MTSQPSPSGPPELLTTNEAAKRLRYNPLTLARWRREGNGPDYVRLGRKVFYTPSALDEFVTDSRVRGREDGSR